MNFDMAFGKLMQIAGRCREVWGKLTRDELCRVSGLQLAVAGRMRVAGGEALLLLERCSARAVAPRR